MKRSWLKYIAILLACMSLSVACGNKKRVAKVTKGTNNPSPTASAKTVQQCQQQKQILMDGSCVAEAACTAKGRTVKDGQCQLPQSPTTATAAPIAQNKPEISAVSQQACNSNPLVKWDGGKCVCANSGTEIKQLSDAQKCQTTGVQSKTDPSAQQIVSMYQSQTQKTNELIASGNQKIETMLGQAAPNLKSASVAASGDLRILGAEVKLMHMGTSMGLNYGRVVVSDASGEKVELTWEGKNIDPTEKTPVAIATQGALSAKAACLAEDCKKFVIVFQAGQSSLPVFGSSDKGDRLFSNQELTTAISSAVSAQ